MLLFGISMLWSKWSISAVAWCSSCSWSVLLVSLSYQVLFGFRSRVILRLRWTVPSLCFASHSNGQSLKMCLCVSRYTTIMAIWSCNRWAVWCRCSCPEELVRACDFVGYWAHLQATGLCAPLLAILCLCFVATVDRSLSRIPDSYVIIFFLFFVAMLSLSPSYGLAKLAVEYNICFEVVTYDTLMIW
jgi:hypothetical protein